MSATNKKKPYKRIALALSLCVLIVWAVLGTGASLAWFTDTSPEVKNIINIAEFDLEVSHRLENGDYELIDGQTDIFDDNALYEPGYTQVVYFKVKNNGTIDFNYQTAVIIRSFTPGTNIFGRTFNLQEYLRFGLVTADTEDGLEALIDTREKAQSYATEELNTYHSTISSLGAGKETYMALVVYMPEEVGNDANYRGLPVPEVKLGISVNATQIQD